MKNFAPFFVTLATFLTFSCFAQPSKDFLQDGTIENKNPIADNSFDNSSSDIRAYHVVERINMNFGGRITTYEVSNLSLVSTNDLGPYNSRVITPKYVKAKAVVSKNLTIQPLKSGTANLKINKIDFTVPKIKKDYVEIDIARSYERILEKGYEAIEMLYIVANRRFFDGDLIEAGKWYEKLFRLSKNLDQVYYYRFSQCLKALGQTEKANEMMKVFESNIENH